MSPSFAAEAPSIPLGQSLLLAALVHYQSLYPNPPAVLPPLEHPLPFPEALLIVLFDLLMATEEYARALFELKKGVRWLQGRGGEKEWEKMRDDREFDVAGYQREGVAEVGAGRELDINLRHRLGLARLQLGHVNEARVSPTFRSEPCIFSNFAFPEINS